MWVRRVSASIFGVVVMLAGAGFLLLPSPPAAAAPPPQGWTTTQAPLPADAGSGSGFPNAYVASATCPAANACVQVGWYEDKSVDHGVWGVIEQQNGTAWTDTEAPQPSDSGSGADQGFWFGSNQCGFDEPCRAVSCPSVSFCVAVGNYLDSADHFQAVIDTETNGTWTSATAALPSDAATDVTTNHPANRLFSVSCSTATSCVAVGGYINQDGVFNGLIDTLSGTTWTGKVAPLPSGASTSTNNLSNLQGISCASATSCAATGQYLDASSGNLGLLEVLANGTWTPSTAPLPSDAATGSDQHAIILQTSCPSTTFCAAVGLYDNPALRVKPVIETWNGTAWSGLAAPLPSDVQASSFDTLASVACGSPLLCVAAGTYSTSSRELGLIETYSGGQWTDTVAPMPSDAATSGSPLLASLVEVACPTGAFCMTVGNYSNAHNVTVAMADTFTGGTWSSVAVPMPSNVTTTSDFAGQGRTVACDSPVACVVGGPYNDNADGRQAFLDTWTGAQGYWLDATDGGIFTYPNNAFYGSTGSLKLNKPMVGMAATPDGQGYWLVASDGGIFSYGDALFHGSRGGQPLNSPIVGMATTPNGKGYWLVASDGGIFTYGDANFFGSTGSIVLNKPVVGMASTPDGRGYWLVASDGGIFSYGDAAFYGSTGSLVLNKPVVGMAASATGLGYWLVASDGGIFSYGDAQFYGSTGSLVLNKPVVGMAASPSGKGYWFVASDGGVFNYGDASFQGSAGSLHLNAPVVGMAGG